MGDLKPKVILAKTTPKISYFDLKILFPDLIFDFIFLKTIFVKTNGSISIAPTQKIGYERSFAVKFAQTAD